MQKSIQIGYDELFRLKCTLAAKAGFRHMSVNFTKVLDKTEDEWKAVTDDIAGILEENGLQCVQSHPYYYDLRISSGEKEERLEFAMKQAVIATGKLGGKWSVFHPRSSISTGFSRKQSLEDNHRAFSEYLEVAVKHNTGIAVENLTIFPDVIPSMPFYSSNYEDVAELCDSFHDDHAAVCWDTGHANLMCFDQAAAIRTLGSRIQCTHIHNNFQAWDAHLTPDNGNIPWNKVMPAFADIGYDGPLTLETHCLYPDPKMLESFAKFNYECLEYLESLTAKEAET